MQLTRARLQNDFVRLEPMHAKAVLLRKDGDRPQAEFGSGAENPDGNLGAIGHEQLLLPGGTGGT